VRPGDRPRWIDLSAEIDKFPVWRAAARRPPPAARRPPPAARRPPIDAILALLLEWSTVVKTPTVDVDALLAAAVHDVQVPRLPPTDGLRAWERQLTGRGPVPEGDELPEICVPARVAAALGHPLDVVDRIDFDSLVQAILVDRAACRHGLTLETWALRTTLASRLHG
jgi:hypothetical protein